MLNTYIVQLVNAHGASDQRQPSCRLVTVRASTLEEARYDAASWHTKEGEYVDGIVNTIEGGYGGAPIS